MDSPSSQDTSEDGSEDKKGQDEKMPANAPDNAPVTSNVGQRPLTFQPSVDDPVQLTNFLKGVHQKYLANRERIFEEMMSAQPEEGPYQKPPPREEQVQPPANPSKPAAKAPQRAAAKAPPRKRRAKTKALPLQQKRQETAPSRGRRRRAGNNASLLRARNIDFQAPDPEAESPPNETEEERRRRKERINGRRKRAKKMIEIDALNETYHKLKEDNAKLKAENEAFRERIAMLKNLKQAGMLNEQQAPQPAAQGVSRGVSRQSSNNDDDDRKPAAVPPQASAPSTRPLFQYALPPAEMALRLTRETTLSRGPREEAKEAFAQPQFVGQRERTDPVAALSVAGLQGYSSLPDSTWTNLSLAQAQGTTPFALQHMNLLSQQTVASLDSALFGQQQQQQHLLNQHLQQQTLLNQHQQQQQQQLLRNMAAAHSMVNAPGLQLQQVLYALQQQQQPQQNQTQQTQPSFQQLLGWHLQQQHRQDPPHGPPPT